tara:strand:+ start:3032 stop:3322 length:291 start_codon:yes stop_codon:yes gene_type:complete
MSNGMPKENDDKFTPDEDGEHKAYYGLLVTYRNATRTPYFKYKLNCESYTRKLHEANAVEYRYEGSIRARWGRWKHANGDEIDESGLAVRERFEKR